MHSYAFNESGGITPGKNIWIYKRTYRVAQKTARYALVHIFAKYWPICIILSPTYSLEICNKIINKDPTSPQMCCYTTVWNVNVRKSLLPSSRWWFWLACQSWDALTLYSLILAWKVTVATTVRCFWVNSCYLPYGRCLATSLCSNKTIGAQDTQDNQAAAVGDARIHLTWSVAPK